MLSVSNDFKNAIKQLSVMSDGEVSLHFGTTTLNFTSDELTSIEIYGSAFTNDKVLGNLAQHSLSLDLLGDVTASIPLNTEIIVKPYIGVWTGLAFEYVQFQDFVVTDINYNDTTNVTHIVATDYLIKLNVEYVDTNVYPMTLKAYLESVLSFCGLSLENTTFFNDDFVVQSKPFVDYTNCKEIIQRVCELSLTFCKINKVTNKLELVNAFGRFMRGYTHEELSAFTHLELSSFTHYQLMNAIGVYDEVINKNNYWNFRLYDHWFGQYGINTLTLKISQVEGENNTVQLNELVAVDGVNPITIADNPFIGTEALRLSVINQMFEEMKFFKYYPYTCEYRGFPYLEIGDVAQIINMNNEPFNSPIYEMTIRYDGGLYGKINANALSKVQSTYLNPSLAKKVKGVEAKVDKVSGEFSILAGNYNNGILVGTRYNFDGTAFTITNVNDDVVFSADALGNLTLVGTIKGVKDGITRVELDEDSLLFNSETTLNVGSIKAYDSGSYKKFSFSDGSTSNEGVRLSIEKILSYPKLYSINMETYIGNDEINGADIEIQSGESGYHSSRLKASTNKNTNIESGYVSANQSGGFLWATTVNASTFNTMYEARIDFTTLGGLYLKSSNYDYKIYFAGAWYTIVVDANGFLKVV